MMFHRAVCWAAAALCAASAAAQDDRERRRERPPRLELENLLGGVPSGAASAETLALSLEDAVLRALDHNLAVLLSRGDTAEAASAAARERSFLLPRLEAGVLESRSEFNLEATSFRDFPLRETLVGPFNVFDARLFLQVPLLDQGRVFGSRASEHALSAQRETERSTRELVVLATGNLYLGAAANQIRSAAAAARLETAAALAQLAEDRNRSGLVPRIEVLRAQAQLEAERARRIRAQHELEKSLLRLKRAIGLPLEQAIVLTDQLRYEPLLGITREEAHAWARRDRAEYLSAELRVREAQADLQAARASHLPTVSLRADVGTIGPDAESARRTFGVQAGLRLPLYEGGRLASRIDERAAELERRTVLLAELGARIAFEIESAFLDLGAAEQTVLSARRHQELGATQLQHARNRFAAGVGDTLEVQAAQEGLAAAEELWVSSLLEHRMAKGALARAIGLREGAMLAYIRGLAEPGAATR